MWCLHCDPYVVCFISNYFVLGPSYLNLLQQEIGIVMSLIIPSKDTKAAPTVTLPKVDETKGTSAVDDIILFNTDKYYSTMDCLKAIYYHTLLLCFVNKLDGNCLIETNKIAETPCEVAEQTIMNSLGSQVTELSSEQVRGMCRFLLCETCVKENQMSSTLEHISRAATRLMKKRADTLKYEDNVVIAEGSRFKQVNC